MTLPLDSSPSVAFTASYQLLIPSDKVEQAHAIAQQIANGQTLGTQDPALLSRLSTYCAQAQSVEVSKPETVPAGQSLLRFSLDFPETVGVAELGALMTLAFGKVSMAGPLRWTGLRVSGALAQTLQGPALGIEGIRAQVGIGDERSPLVMAILKPCLGLSPSELADLMATQAEAGTHLVKDDEILTDADFDSALRRLEACQKAIARNKTRAGNLLYANNLNGPAHTIFDRAERLLAAGADAFLFNYLAYGLPTLNSLRQLVDGRAAILGHPALGGAYYGSPWHGLSPSLVFGTLPRLAGADAVLFPSPYGKVCLPREDALAIHQELLTPDLPVKPTFAVPSAGIQADMVPRIVEDFGGQVIINAGTGIFDSPLGPVAGARAFLDQVPGTLISS